MGTRQDNHLGRNPFSAKTKSSPTAPDSHPEPGTGATADPKGINWFLVDLPAETFLFALKTTLLVKSVFDSKKS